MNSTPGLHAIRDHDHQQGDLSAKVLLVEYGDFQCPTCKQAAPAVEMLRKTFADQLLFVFRHYPLEQIHPEALVAAEAAESAGAQGKFWEMHGLLFAHQQHLQLRDLANYALQLDLDPNRFRADMQSHAHLARVRADMALGVEARVRSTPAFFVNGSIQDVSFGLHALHDAVAAAARSS